MDLQVGRSLYAEIGGVDGIDRLIQAFYQRVCADAALAPFFARVSMNKLIHMQREFFCAALDGPLRYTGRPVIHAHQGLGITREHFAAFARHLFETLHAMNINEDDRYAIIARINTYYDDVVNVGAGGDS